MFPRSSFFQSSSPVSSACLCIALVLCGCKSRTAPDDAALTASSQAQLSSDSSLAGQPITATVNNGVVNLNGNVANDAQKTLAARDVAGIPGVKEVNNNLMVGPAAATVTAPPTVPVRVAPIPVPVPAPGQTIQQAREQQRAQDQALERAQAHAQQLAQQKDQREQQRRQNQNQANPLDTRQPAPIERQQQAYNPPAPVAPAQPSFRNVNVPAGTTIPVRVTQTLDSATTQEGDAFSGVVASDVVIDGATVIPAGATVSGHVDAVHEAAHFKGSSLLTVSLASISRRGDRMAVSSDPYSVQGKGRGTNSAEKIGGGAAIGAIIGGIFGGGKGAAIGAGAGGGLGAGAQAVTKGQQVQIPSETVVRFHLASPLSIRTRTDQSATQRNPDGLQPRNE